MRSLLFGIEPTDVPSYVGAAAALLAVALAACLVPARRAAASDPSVALTQRLALRVDVRRQSVPMRIALAVALVALRIGWPAAAAGSVRPRQAPATRAGGNRLRRRHPQPGRPAGRGARPSAFARWHRSRRWRRRSAIARSMRGGCHLARGAALAGLDVEQPPGPLALTILGARASGGPLSQVVALAVEPAAFAERRLNVPPRFVDPPESERPRIEREAVRLHAIYQAVSSDSQPGGFVPPVPHPRSSPFGSRSVFNGVPRDRHAGLDFASPAGAVIRAPAPGRVVLVADLYYTGNTVVIDHGQGALLDPRPYAPGRWSARARRRPRSAAGHGRRDGPRHRPASALVGAARRHARRSRGHPRGAASDHSRLSRATCGRLPRRHRCYPRCLRQEGAG